VAPKPKHPHRPMQPKSMITPLRRGLVCRERAAPNNAAPLGGFHWGGHRANNTMSQVMAKVVWASRSYHSDRTRASCPESEVRQGIQAKVSYFAPDSANVGVVTLPATRRRHTRPHIATTPVARRISELGSGTETELIRIKLSTDGGLGPCKSTRF
jgi:hypothetical protein